MVFDIGLSLFGLPVFGKFTAFLVVPVFGKSTASLGGPLRTIGVSRIRVVMRMMSSPLAVGTGRRVAGMVFVSAFGLGIFSPINLGVFMGVGRRIIYPS